MAQAKKITDKTNFRLTPLDVTLIQWTQKHIFVDCSITEVFRSALRHMVLTHTASYDPSMLIAFAEMNTMLDLPDQKSQNLLREQIRSLVLLGEHYHPSQPSGPSLNKFEGSAADFDDEG